jgi:hypothetical protein
MVERLLVETAEPRRVAHAPEATAKPMPVAP